MKIAIIGAGAAGLASLKHSLDAGNTCEVFEQTAFIGGTWKYVEKVGKDEYGLPIHSSMYENLRTNKPKELMLFEDFPYREDLVCSYISYVEVLKYINDYAQHFKLVPHIKFRHHVEYISPIQGERWLVKVKNLKTTETEEIEFDSVIVCVGHYSKPITPSIPGMEYFKGTIIHSHDYRKINPYIDRKVLIVGNGPSGVDICNRVHTVAKKVVLSMRSQKDVDFSHTLPVNLIKKPPIEQFYENSVKFEDQSEEEFDDVIFCTGYTISFPFLSSTSGLEVSQNFIKYLYKHTINIEHPTMAVIGIPIHLPLFPMFCLQVRFFLAHLNGHFKVTKENMMQDVEKHLNNCKESGKQPHMEMGLSFRDFLIDLAETANIKGIKPVRFFLAHLNGHFKVTKENMMQDVEKHLNNCKESGKQPHMEMGLSFRDFLIDLAETANIKGIKPVIFKMFDFLIQEGLGKFDIAYKIINDNEFEHFRYNN